MFGSSWWLWYCEALQVAGFLMIAYDVYRIGRDPDAPMRAILLAIKVRDAFFAAWRGLRATEQRLEDAWRRFRHIPRTLQVSADDNMSMSGDLATLTVRYVEDNRVTIELRRQITELQSAQRQTDATLADQARRLDSLQQAHRELAAGGIVVQAWTIALVVVGSLIATASSGLSHPAWWATILVIASPIPVAYLVRSPRRKPAAPTA